jgi:enoyl-CoA hydratase/carnithine racemase
MIKTDISGDIGIISLDRPPVNAINPDLVSDLTDTLDSFKTNNDVNGVILQGRDGCFSGGLDITHLFPKDRSYIEGFWKDFSSLLLNMFSYEKPLYSSIGGHCPAGGTVMVIMTDYRVMSKGNYVIGLNEVDVGLTVPYGIGMVFQYVVGNRNAEDLLLKAKLISPDEALRVGLVDELCDAETLLDVTLERIAMASNLYSPQQSKTKQILREQTLSIVEQNFERDAQLILDSWFSESGQQRLEDLYKRLSRK